MMVVGSFCEPWKSRPNPQTINELTDLRKATTPDRPFRKNYEILLQSFFALWICWVPF